MREEKLKHPSTPTDFDALSYESRFDFVLRPFCKYVKGFGDLTQEVYYKQAVTNAPVSIIDIRNDKNVCLIMTFPYRSLPFDRAPQQLFDDLGESSGLEGEASTASVVKEEMDKAMESQRDKWRSERRNRRSEATKFASERAFTGFDGEHILVACSKWGKFFSFYDVDLVGLQLMPLMKLERGARDPFGIYRGFYFCLSQSIDHGIRGNPIIDKDGITIGAPLELKIHESGGIRYVSPLHDIAFCIYNKQREKNKLVKPEIPVITDLDFFIDGDNKRLICPTMEQLEKVFS